ncbi:MULTISPECIES: PH domain-containing protein [unclassified Acinetobacter]|uniref:PH domain-containing protein n=1 Tax=unclassified Acinetobacter TaxID=196816 RepID=UPI00190C9EFD|nr:MULTISPECIES: PH domain-containing protein [unclassified Acinetobacter]MBK0062852.1 PH domain-containing protein [Acinetobacter sp. S55]MBK0065571.1 PH domain-containing protein [Acinetobacter sp. S54]
MHTFRSKKDWWILGFIIAATGILLQMLWSMQLRGTLEDYPEHGIVYALVIAIMWWPVVNTRYVVTDDQLIIHSMFLTWTILRSNIQNITPTNNPLSSPALSLDRLRIDYLKDGKSKYVLVSPKDKQKFTEALHLDHRHY